MAGDGGRHKERKRIFRRKRDQGLCSIFPEAVPPLRKCHEEPGRAGESAIANQSFTMMAAMFSEAVCCLITHCRSDLPWTSFSPASEEISSESEMRGEEIAAGDVSSPEEGIRILSDKVMVRQAVVVNHSQYCCISVLSGTVQERRNIPDGLEYTSKQYSGN
ncbi:hypothetical protein Q8A67_023841 [Cirrhinus molitorella]|uniref:Uncharacterized protein n=1 Tax=Cirrhinus molitorella TaxID=172907 RepID=A0AA88TLB7_9TELE|nr:hypothetical protein Q8A67_023841 [Cirrhinus molitorella]